MQENEEQPGKVQLKTILKGSAAQAIQPAAMSGFKVADFQINPMATVETPEDRLKHEIAALHSQVTALNGEIASLKNKIEHDTKAAYSKGAKDSKNSGIEEGEKKAFEKWNADLKALQENVAKEFENLAEQQKANFEKISAETTELAIAIAKRIFCEEAAQNPNIIARVLKEAFTFLGQEEKLKVRLNPMDVPSAEKTESFWKPTMSSLKNIELVLDSAIEKGGCLLESENGSSIDMRVQTVFGHVEKIVKQIYDN